MVEWTDLSAASAIENSNLALIAYWSKFADRIRKRSSSFCPRLILAYPNAMSRISPRDDCIQSYLCNLSIFKILTVENFGETLIRRLSQWRVLPRLPRQFQGQEVVCRWVLVRFRCESIRRWRSDRQGLLVLHWSHRLDGRQFHLVDPDWSGHCCTLFTLT